MDGSLNLWEGGAKYMFEIGATLDFFLFFWRLVGPSGPNSSGKIH